MANDFLPFCPTDTGTNLISLADYLLEQDRITGNAPGIASLELNNRALRQANIMASQLAQYVVNKTGLSMLDDGSLSTIQTNLVQGLNGIYNAGGVAGGTGDAITLTPTIPLLSYNAGVMFSFIAIASNTGAVTVSISGLAAKSIRTLSDLILPSNTIISGYLYTIIYDGTHFRVVELFDGANILDGAIGSTKLGVGAVTSGKIASGAVIAGKIDTGGVVAGNIAAGAVVAGDLAAASVDSASLQTNLNLPGNTVQENGKNLVVSNTNAAASLSVIRGNVADSGTILYGEGFTITALGGGGYSINFSTAFADVPSVIVNSLAPPANQYFTIVSISTTVAVISANIATNSGFSFIAMGQRA